MTNKVQGKRNIHPTLDCIKSDDISVATVGHSPLTVVGYPRIAVVNCALSSKEGGVRMKL